MELSELKKIGLTEGEIKVYLALLELGETTRTELAKKSRVSASKLYDVANRLTEKGIVSAVKKDGIIHFSAADPERLRDFITKKESEVQKEKEVVEKLISSIQAEYAENVSKSDVEVLYGWGGMKTAFWDIAKSLSKGDKNFIFGASSGHNPKQADIFFAKYFEEVDKKGYEIDIIYNEDMRNSGDRVKYFHDSKTHKIRYLHSNTFTELNVYKNVVLIVMLLKKPIVIRIRNEEAADSFRKFFGTIWAQAKP